MSNKTLFTLLFLVLTSMGILLAVNLSTIYGKTSAESFLTLNEISGMATTHNGKIYTLNFEQQTKVAAILNRSVKIDKDQLLKISPTHFDYSSLTIYRFGKDSIILKPVGLMNKQLLLQSDTLLLREIGPGELQPLLSQTYDNASHA